MCRAARWHCRADRAYGRAFPVGWSGHADGDLRGRREDELQPARLSQDVPLAGDVLRRAAGGDARRGGQAADVSARGVALPQLARSRRVPVSVLALEAKWDSYQLATEVIFLIEDGKVKGALRSATQDKERPTTARVFDGNWVWKDAAGKDQPEAAIYARLFSPTIRTSPSSIALTAPSRRSHGRTTVPSATSRTTVEAAAAGDPALPEPRAHRPPRDRSRHP